MKEYHLYGAPACGSAMAEMFLVAADIPFTLTELKFGERKKWKKIFGRYNSALQVPTLVIDGKKVLTESLAIAAHCDERGAKLVPRGKNADEFWRWAMFINSNIYPTFLFCDNAADYVPGTAAARHLEKKMIARRKMLWKQVEAAAGAPWFLGKQSSAIDIYLAVMMHWGPGEAWFKKNCPRLAKIAARGAEIPIQRVILRRHFPKMK